MLRSSADGSATIKPYSGDTDIFLYPGCQFRVVDAMITNFHLPESTLIMLVSAFAGVETIRDAYRVAVENRYRFFSYGDAMFLTNREWRSGLSGFTSDGLARRGGSTSHEAPFKHPHLCP